MLFVLSPAKSLDYDSPAPELTPTDPLFSQRSRELIEILRRLSPADLATLMSISDPLAQLNAGRFAAWSLQSNTHNARPAVFAFNGDVYEGLDARTLAPAALGYVQEHLRILSGLYGLLRPSDWLQPYRLEMGTRLNNPHGGTLYDFWGDAITEALNAELEGRCERVLVNLASEEYFRAVRPAKLTADIVTPVFEEWKAGKYKVVSFHAKRARGLMVRWAAGHRASVPEALQDFNLEGYRFEPEASSGNRWIFRRRMPE